MKVVNTANPRTISEDFATRDIELTAFALACGIRCSAVQHLGFKLVEFRFTSTPDLQRAIATFECGAGPIPPAKAIFRALRLVRGLAEASNSLDIFVEEWREYARN